MNVISILEGVPADEGKFHPSGNQLAQMLLLAMEVMRMVTYCCNRDGLPQHTGMLLRCVHLLRHILAACPLTPLVCLILLPVTYLHPLDLLESANVPPRLSWMHADCTCSGAQGDQGTHKLLRSPIELARLPYTPTCGWQHALWKAVAKSVAMITVYLKHPWRPHEIDHHKITVDGFPSTCVGFARTALYLEVTDCCGLHTTFRWISEWAQKHASCQLPSSNQYCV